MYSKRTRQLAALLFMDRVARRLHKSIPPDQAREWSPEYKAWAIAFSALCQITEELGDCNYYDVRWGILED